jgi:hypothetical protein
MKNFGRGMWRRVGDYDKLYVPLIKKNNEMQYYLDLLEKSQRQKQKQIVKRYPIEPVTETVTEIVTETVEPVEPVTETVETVTETVEPVTEIVETVTEIVEPVTEIVEPVTETVETVTVEPTKKRKKKKTQK